MIKILHVLSDSNVGGAGKWLVEFLKYYNKERFKISVAIPEGSELKKYIEKFNNVDLYQIKGIRDKSFSFSGIVNSLRLMKKINPDIVHTSSVLSSRLAAIFLNIKSIYTKHCVYEPKKIFTKKIFRKINNSLNTKTCEKIIAVAEDAKSNLIKLGIDEKKICVILNGVSELKKLSPLEIKAIKEKYKIKPNKKIVGIIARLSQSKGHMLFLETIKTIKNLGIKNIIFIIAGSGKMEKPLKEKIKKLCLEDLVIMTGFLDNVTEIMNIIDVQVNCSIEGEATSLSLLEGLSIGKPCVVTDAGGNSKIIKNEVNGFVVPIKKPKKMAECLIKILNDDETYLKFSKSCIEIFKKKFTAKTMTEKIEKIYEEIFNISAN
ncbi:MAG: glycosyltransferase [Clostridiales bacterium]|jgi:glycosyltransferase involved in cell wall biosynthesis|nr:glycosyltransferase [Clostridiales bacterium]